MKKLSYLLCSGLVAAALVPGLNADPVKHRTDVTFSGPIEIPGMVLSAGSYMIKIPDPYTHRYMVGFYDSGGQHLYKLVRTVPAYRNTITSKTVITFEERANGAPPAIHTWFEPAAYDGFEFVYPKAQPLNTAENTAPAAPSPLVASAAPVPTPAPAPVAEQTPAPAPAPVEIAQATPPAAPQAAPQPTPAASTPAQELPKTASDFPMVLAAGGFLVFAGLGLRLRA